MVLTLARRNVKKEALMIYLPQALILVFNRPYRCHLHCEFSIDQARIMDQPRDIALAVMADGARTVSHCDFFNAHASRCYYFIYWFPTRLSLEVSAADAHLIRPIALTGRSLLDAAMPIWRHRFQETDAPFIRRYTDIHSHPSLASTPS